MSIVAKEERGSRYDVVVVGAGFGGLAAALTLAERGAKVLLCEALAYPGGCASTFTRKGWRFETGATLFSGFGEGHLMARWIARHQLPVQVERLDPMVTLRAPGLSLPVPSDRDAFVTQLCALPGAPAARIRAYFAEHTRVATALWEVFADPTLLPPFDLRALLAHAGRAPRYLPLLRSLGQPLARMLERHGLADFAPLRLWLDATCQITVQCGVDAAEGPFAIAASDYYFQGTGHVHGGIGVLAEALVGAIRRAGGEVRMASRVAKLAPDESGWRVEVRGETVWAPKVVLNTLPQGALKLLDDAHDRFPGSRQRLHDRGARVAEGWGACMLYLGLRPGAELPPEAHHLQIVQDPTKPLREGNHLFASVSALEEVGRAPEAGGRTVTVSTHVPLAGWRELDDAGRAARTAEVQARMWEGLVARAPALAEAVVTRMPASPRTWERYTRRSEGAVGGIPRVAGLHNYTQIGPCEALPGVWLVGDSVFPGQSTLATALGGVRAAEAVVRAGR